MSDSDQIDKELAEILLCECIDKNPLKHHVDCPAYFHEAVAAWARKREAAAHVAGMREALTIAIAHRHVGTIAAAIAAKEGKVDTKTPGE